MSIALSATGGPGPSSRPPRRSPPREVGTLTGWHVLAMLLAFFGVMFVANGCLVYYALGTFSGTVTDSSYQASQHYNLDIAAARAQEVRNWRVAAEARRAADGQVTVRILARDADGVPINDVDFRAVLQRPTSRSEDRPVTLTANLDQPGVYLGALERVAAGQWSLVIEADTDRSPGRPSAVGEGGPQPHLFRSESRIVFK